MNHPHTTKENNIQTEELNRSIEFNADIIKGFSDQQRIQFLEKVFEHLPLAVFIYDCINLQQIWANKEARKRINISSKYPLKKTLNWYLSHFHADDKHIIIESINAFTNNNASEFIAVYRIKSDETDKWQPNHCKSIVFYETDDKTSKYILTMALNISNEEIDMQKNECKRKNEALYNLLTKREKQVLQYIAKGNCSSEISEIMNISKQTLATYRKNILKKLNLHSVNSLISFALETGL